MQPQTLLRIKLCQMSAIRQQLQRKGKTEKTGRAKEKKGYEKDKERTCRGRRHGLVAGGAVPFQVLATWCEHDQRIVEFGTVGLLLESSTVTWTTSLHKLF